MELYDLIIIGGGPAGLAAGLYAARRNLKVIILSETLGGQMALAPSVENYPGTESVSGLKLAEKMRKQAERFGCEFKLAKVVSLELKNEVKKVKTTEKEYLTKTVLIATGSHYRKLEAEGEDKFIGKGVSYCAVCLPPKEEIVCNSNITPIQGIIPNTKVLTLDGKYHEVKELTKNLYNGELISIKTRFFSEEVLLTPNHLVLKLNVSKGNGGNYWKKFAFSNPQWIEVDKLKKNDILIYPIIKDTKDIEFLKISDFLDVKIDKDFAHNKRETHTSVKIPNKIKINDEFLRLIGYFLAEGCILKHGISFYFNKKEKDYVNDLEKIIKNLFNLNASIKRIDNIYKITIYSHIIKELFNKLFGKYSYNKCLPQWIITLPVEKQAELIKGFWRGDGCIRKKDFTLVTNSRKLTYQLRDIFLRLGIIPSIQKRSKESLNRRSHSIEGRNIVFKHDKYHLVVGGPSLNLMSKVLDVKHPKLISRKFICRHAWIKDGRLLLPVRCVRTIDYNGYVYNIVINENPTYVAKNFIVHNCDGPCFKNKKVAVIGGSDTAVRSAIYLSGIASETYLIHRRDQLRAEEISQKNLEKAKVKIILNSVVEKIEGDKFVKKIIINNVNTNDKTELAVDGVFIEVGEVPTTEIVKSAGVEINEKNFIKVDDKFQTNIPGVFAAGDVTGSFAQIVVAAAEGAEATTNVYLFLKGGFYGEKKPADYGEKK
jgi:thioredoxin reductase/intein/homing endonuclease